MKFTPKKFLQGGAIEEAPIEEASMEEASAAPEEMGLQDPLMQLAQAAALALQTQDPNLAFQVCLGLLTLIQLMGSAPSEPEGEPVFARNGTKLQIKRRIKK